MIFPGMDPYLEDPLTWPGLHHRLITYIADLLQPALRPRYAATIEERVYVEGAEREVVADVAVKKKPTGTSGPVGVVEADTAVMVRVPNVEVHEGYVAIRDRKTGREVVTVIEVISPANKYAGPGRVQYETKQREVLASDTHLVEIDLLRNGPHVLAVPEWAAARQRPYHYLVSVNRAGAERAEFELYPRQLPQRLPRIRLPLRGDDPDVVLDVQAAVAEAYAKGVYREDIDYSQPCAPRLSADEQAWANQLIQQSRQPASEENR